MDCKQEYTVFTKDGGHQNSDEEAGQTVPEIIEWLIENGWTPVAWCEGYNPRGVTEARAAGRLIEKTPSGWVALGAEKQEESDLPELVKNFQQRELRKGEPTSADLAMIARDLTGAENKALRETVRKVGTVVHQGEVTRTAKPNTFPAFRSPDFCDHLNASRHQLASKQFHQA